ncbi:hypothetical protein A0H81_12030 [Grifola frondosa]|uniref:Uncharacterized protein n=1 Tax=Grifola frondosa TaxID=5627 RepID=A0A1C7LTQ4_GRIFR|nr:hypothetical protein A0H81_12030 [Grifola frondosa]
MAVVVENMVGLKAKKMAALRVTNIIASKGSLRIESPQQTYTRRPQCTSSKFPGGMQLPIDTFSSNR